MFWDPSSSLIQTEFELILSGGNKLKKLNSVKRDF